MIDMRWLLRENEVVKRLFLALASAIFILGVFVGNAFAQEEPQSIDAGSSLIAPDYFPPYPRPEPGFLGQDHSYTVTFRGNGEAVVSARVILTNKEEVPLSELSLRVPKVEPREIFVYQVIRDKQCIRYRPQVYDPLTRTYPPQICEEYQDADYYNYYGAAKYQKAKFEYVGDTISITFPTEIAPNNSGSYFIFYRAGGYTSKNIFGGFKYDFETLKVNDDIRSLNVAIDVDSDLVLKGGQAEVNYRFADVSETTFKGVGGAAPLASGAIDTFYSNIGYGRIIKNATNLSPLESYTVSGSYASNQLKLYAKEVAISIFVVVVFVLVIVLVSRRVYSRFLKAEIKAEKTSGIFGNAGHLVISTGIGFISALIISGYTTMVILLGGIITRSINYQYNSIFVLFLVLISFGVYGLLLFGPALYMGVKKGIGWGISSAIATIVWLIIFLVIAFGIIFLTGGLYSEPIVPLFEGFSR